MMVVLSLSGMQCHCQLVSWVSVSRIWFLFSATSVLGCMDAKTHDLLSAKATIVNSIPNCKRTRKFFKSFGRWRVI